MSEQQAVQFWKGVTWVTVAYFVALVVGLVVGRLVPADSTLWTALWADIAATVVIFVFSFSFQNSSFYDAYWSVVPIGIVGYWILEAGATGDTTRQALVFAGVTLWGVRLTVNWLTGWTGLAHVDWRYIQLRRQTGIAYWLVSLAGIHMFPTLLVFLGLWSAHVAVTEGGPVHLLDWVATATVVAGVWLEATADSQLRAWRARNTDPQAFIDEGLWHWSRHPNYLGELTVWCGLWLFAMAAAPSQWPTVAGPVAMAVLFRFISIPMMEERMLGKRPGYQAQIDSTSMLFLWPPKAKPEAPQSSPD